MKATGIVRRIDDLGRVVIPKEIRRTVIKSIKEIFIARVPSNKVLGTFQKSPIFRKVRFLYMKATGAQGGALRINNE